MRHLLREGMIQAIEIDSRIEKSIIPQGAGEDEVSYLRRHYAQRRAFWNEEKPIVREVVDKAIPTRFGSVNCRFYYNGTEESPVLFYIHGGGFVIGSIDTHDRIMRLHAANGHCNVIGINYSKSPEHKCPHALHEILNVLEFCYQQASELGLNAKKFSVSGDSAGAHLSLAAMLKLRDSKSEVKIASALLYYGNFGLLDSPSMRLFGSEDFTLSWELIEFYKNHYLADNENAYKSEFNLLACDMTGLAPMLIAGLALDPLRDDSRLLAEKVKQAGGIYKFSEYEGVLHGFLHYSKVLADSYLMMSEGLAFMWSQFRC